MNVALLVAKELKEPGKVACLAATDKTNADTIMALFRDEARLADALRAAGLSGECLVEVLRRAPHFKRRQIVVAEPSKKVGRK
jgi:hypothetical protein